jgi:hypothetical protein
MITRILTTSYIGVMQQPWLSLSEALLWQMATMRKCICSAMFYGLTASQNYASDRCRARAHFGKIGIEKATTVVP